MTPEEHYQRGVELLKAAEGCPHDPSGATTLASIAHGAFTASSAGAGLRALQAMTNEVQAAAPANPATDPAVRPARFGIAVDHENPAHVRFRLFAATGGQHLGQCGELVMQRAEYDAFTATLGPLLTDRSDPPAATKDGAPC